MWSITRWDGSNVSPRASDPTASKAASHNSGLCIRLRPRLGQFSKASLIPARSAWAATGPKASLKKPIWSATGRPSTIA
jgi:hypothetical protein